MERQDVIDYAEVILQDELDWGNQERAEALREIIKTFKQKPCDDAISREDVYKVLERNWLNSTVARRIANEFFVNELRESIKSLPSVQPKVKTGHWYDKCGNDACSICGEEISDAQTFDGRPFRYCPMCGKRMVEPQESEVKNEDN
jgi:hypothetical protein